MLLSCDIHVTNDIISCRGSINWLRLIEIYVVYTISSTSSHVTCTFHWKLKIPFLMQLQLGHIVHIEPVRTVSIEVVHKLLNAA